MVLCKKNSQEWFPTKCVNSRMFKHNIAFILYLSFMFSTVLSTGGAHLYDASNHILSSFCTYNIMLSQCFTFQLYNGKHLVLNGHFKHKKRLLDLCYLLKAMIARPCSDPSMSITDSVRRLHLRSLLQMLMHASASKTTSQLSQGSLHIFFYRQHASAMFRCNVT